jgi:hypothetical protein
LTSAAPVIANLSIADINQMIITPTFVVQCHMRPA